MPSVSLSGSGTVNRRSYRRISAGTACWALTQGVIDYVGPELPEDKKKAAKAEKPEKPAKAKAEKPREQAAPVVAALVSPVEDVSGTAPLPAPVETAPKPVRPRRPRAPKAAVAPAPAKAKPTAK